MVFMNGRKSAPKHLHHTAAEGGKTKMGSEGEGARNKMNQVGAKQSLSRRPS